MILWNEMIKKKLFFLLIFYLDLVFYYLLFMKWEFSRVILMDVIGVSNNWYFVIDINNKLVVRLIWNCMYNFLSY